jgi:hypothetical protein
VYAVANKQLNKKLNGRKIELTLEQAPQTFSIDDKTHAIFLLYVVHWDQVFMEPETKDMVVSYKLYDSSNMIKTGRITIKDTQNKNTLGFFQSIKSGTTKYLDDYNDDISLMTKKIVDNLVEEL